MLVNTFSLFFPHSGDMLFKQSLKAALSHDPLFCKGFLLCAPTPYFPSPFLCMFFMASLPSLSYTFASSVKCLTNLLDFHWIHWSQWTTQRLKISICFRVSQDQMLQILLRQSQFLIFFCKYFCSEQVWILSCKHIIFLQEFFSHQKKCQKNVLEIKPTEKESKQLYFEKLVFDKQWSCFFFKTFKDELKFFGGF